MAQGRAREALAPAAAAAANAPQKLTDKEAYEIQQYEKIVRFHEAVLLGAHPTIKPPQAYGALVMKSPPGPARTAPQARVHDAPGRDLRPSSTEAMSRDVGAVDSAGRGRAPAPPPVPMAPSAAGQAEADPSLPENPDQLVKADIMAQRQRLERALRDQVQQRRSAKRATSERSSDLDLSDVLNKALALVPAGAAPAHAAEDLTAANEAASDSFDDNTFYSSQYDTPQSHLTSRIPNESDEPRSPDGALRQRRVPGPHMAGEPRHQPAQPMASPRPADPADSPAKDTAAAPHASVVPGLNYIGGNVSTQPSQNTASGEQSQSDESANVEAEPWKAGGPMGNTQTQRDSLVDSHPPSPLVRGHALQPVAPQPAQISPLAMAAPAQDTVHPAVQRPKGTPAQVAALRSEQSAATSPDYSSSKGGRGPGKKKGKKKKRKADRQAPELERSPYIKAEPRSPSPLTAPAYMRAKKRRRHSRGQMVEPGEGYEPRYEQPLVHGPGSQHLPRQHRGEPVPLGYGSVGAYPARAVSAALMGDPRYGSEYMDDRHVRGYGLPSAVPPLAYSPAVAYPPRPAARTFAGDGYREPRRPLHEYAEGHQGVRPEGGDVYGGQPASAQPRMMVDAFGREYLDASGVQRPLAPSVGPGDAGVVYERLPLRAVPRHGGPEPYGEGGVMYGGASAPYALTRRVVSHQPEYAPYDCRDSQHSREYPARPMAAPGDYVEAGVPRERRPVEEAPAGAYGAARAASMMPVETVRYEMPQGYGRVQSVRPETAGREYGGGVHPESRREAVQPYLREYAARPMEQYHDRRHRPQARGADEIAFIERPRGTTQEIVYADDGRREIYR